MKSSQDSYNLKYYQLAMNMGLVFALTCILIKLDLSYWLLRFLNQEKNMMPLLEFLQYPILILYVIYQNSLIMSEKLKSIVKYGSSKTSFDFVLFSFMVSYFVDLNMHFYNHGNQYVINYKQFIGVICLICGTRLIISGIKDEHIIQQHEVDEEVIRQLEDIQDYESKSKKKVEIDKITYEQTFNDYNNSNKYFMLGVSRINHITLVHTKLEMLISTKYHLNIYGHSTTGFSAWSTQKKDIPSLEYSESIIYNICMYFSQIFINKKQSEHESPANKKRKPLSLNQTTEKSSQSNEFNVIENKVQNYLGRLTPTFALANNLVKNQQKINLSAIREEQFETSNVNIETHEQFEPNKPYHKRNQSDTIDKALRFSFDNKNKASFKDFQDPYNFFNNTKQESYAIRSIDRHDEPFFMNTKQLNPSVCADKKEESSPRFCEKGDNIQDVLKKQEKSKKNIPTIKSLKKNTKRNNTFIPKYFDSHNEDIESLAVPDNENYDIELETLNDLHNNHFASQAYQKSLHALNYDAFTRQNAEGMFTFLTNITPKSKQIESMKYRSTSSSKKYSADSHNVGKTALTYKEKLNYIKEKKNEQIEKPRNNSSISRSSNTKTNDRKTLSRSGLQDFTMQKLTSQDYEKRTSKDYEINQNYQSATFEEGTNRDQIKSDNDHPVLVIDNDRHISNLRSNSLISLEKNSKNNKTHL